MSSSLVYWVLMLDGISITLGLLAFVFCAITIAFAFGVIYQFCEEEPYVKHFVCLFLISGIIASVFLLAAVFTPNTKQMATIIILPKIANSEFVQETLPKDGKLLYDLAVGYIKKELKEDEK